MIRNVAYKGSEMVFMIDYATEQFIKESEHRPDSFASRLAYENIKDKQKLTETRHVMVEKDFTQMFDKKLKQ